MKVASLEQYLSRLLSANLRKVELALVVHVARLLEKFAGTIA